MISEILISEIERLKRKCEEDCGVGTWCHCGAMDHNKRVDLIINKIHAENTKECAQFGVKGK
jgi:hypothetical protein